MSNQPSYTPPTPSLLARYVAFPFYDYIVQFYPKRWTPNAITICGILCTVTASLLLLLAIPVKTSFTFTESTRANPIAAALPFMARAASSSGEFVPRLALPRCIADWVELPLSLLGLNESLPYVLIALAGFLNLAYCVADNTDGRHARRTKQSSFTGEYLDHGLDCVTSLMSTFLLMAVLGVPLASCALGILLVAFATNLSHIVNHEQGIMIWGNDYFTVDEGMLLFGFGMWVPCIFPSVPSLTIPEIVSTYIPLLAGFEVRYVDAVFCALLLGQLHVMWIISQRDFSIWTRPTTLAMAANAIIMLASASSIHEISPSSASGNKVSWSGCQCCLSYPALWLLTAACTSSLICHIPIIAKCLGDKAAKARCDHTPIGVVIIVWLLFWSHPKLGAALAVAVHIGQVLFNLHRINKKRQNAKPRSE